MFLILKAPAAAGVPSPAATDRLTSALGIVELLANPRQAERLEGKEERTATIVMHTPENKRTKPHNILPASP